MFDLSVIPYIVFAFMAIPPFIFGYFKGWRSGLFTLLLTITTGGILIGVSVGIYDSVLWPLFKNIFISNHNPGGLDVDSLKEISKTSVISIAVGMALIPAILIMWALYGIFKKLLNKYMAPKINKVSSNEVSIQRKNLKLTKAGGVLLNGAAGLIVASAATGAISTLVVPSKSSNFFYSMTNVFSDGMTFGQAQYNENYQRMFEFIKGGNQYSNQIDDFRSMFYQNQSADGSFGVDKKIFDSFIKPLTPEELKIHDKFITETNLMAGDSREISKALVLMLLNASKTLKDFHLVGYDSNDYSKVTKENEQKMKVGDDLVSTTEDSIKDSIKELSEFIKNNDSLIKWNKEGVQEGLKEFFDSRYVAYEFSPYRFRLNHSKNALADANDKLIKMKQRLQKDNKNIKQLRETQTKNVSGIINSGNEIKTNWDQVINLMTKIGLNTNTGSGYPTLVSKPELTVLPWSGKWTSIKDDESEVSTNYYTSIPFIQNLPQLSDGVYKEREDISAINTKNLGITETKKQEVDDIEIKISNENTKLNTLQSDLNKIISKLDSERKTLSDARVFLSNFGNLQASAQKKLDDETTKYNDLNIKATEAQNKLSIAIANLSIANSEQSTAKQNAESASINYKAASDLEVNLKGKLQTDQNSLDAAKTQKDADDKALTNAQNKLNDANDKYKIAYDEAQAQATPEHPAKYIQPVPSTLTDDVNASKIKLKASIKKMSDLQALVTLDQGNLQNQENILLVNKSELDVANEKLGKANKDLEAAEKEKTVAQTANNNAQSLLSASQKTKDSYESQLNTLNSEKSIQTDNQNKMNKAIPNDEALQIQKEKVIVQEKSAIAQLERNLVDANQEYGDAKRKSDKSTEDLDNKQKELDALKSKLDQAEKNIAKWINEGTSLKNAEETLESDLRSYIKDKNVLSDTTKTDSNPKDSLKTGVKPIKPIHKDNEAHWSILDQTWTVSDIKNAKAQYADIDKEKEELYKVRKTNLIEDITKLLS